MKKQKQVRRKGLLTLALQENDKVAMIFQGLEVELHAIAQDKESGVQITICAPKDVKIFKRKVFNRKVILTKDKRYGL